MLRVEQNKDEIIIREIPLMQGILNFVLGAILLLVCFLTFSFEKQSDLQFWSVMMGLGGAISFFMSLTRPIITTKINKPGQTVSIRKQSLIKYSFTVYSFNEIADSVYVAVAEGGRGTKVYQLILPMKDGKKIELSTIDGSKESQYFDAAELINPYIFDTSKQIPFKLTIFEDD